MRFTCLTNNLSEGLMIATEVISSHATGTDSENVYISAAQEQLTLYTSNGNTNVVTTIDADIEEEGFVAIQAKFLLDIIKKLPSSQTMSMTDTEKDTVIRCLGVKVSIKQIVSHEIPNQTDLMEAVSKQCIHFSSKTLREMVASTAFSAAVDDQKRPVLQGCLLNVNAGVITMVALDGFRMAVRKEKIEQEDAAMEAVIPTNTLNYITKILNTTKAENTELYLDGNNFMFSIGRTQFYSSSYSDPYIDYKKILPKDYLTKTYVRKELFLRAVERAALVTQQSKNNLLKMHIAPEEIVITANNDLAEIYEEIPAETEGNGLDIAFNVRYMQDILRVITTDEIEIRCKSSISPCLILPKDQDNASYLVLPVRVGA